MSFHIQSLDWYCDSVSPPPRLKPSEFAEKFAYIPSEGNSEPGKYRLSRMPHQRDMLDDPVQPGVRENIWMLASQAGGKTICINLLCEYVIHQLKKSIIVARATKETAQEWIRDKLLPSIDATPCMKGLLVEPRKRGSNSTSLNRKFPGGGIKVIGAKSPAAFRGASAGYLFGDEIDSWTTIKEGDPLALLYRAAITFPKAWKIIASTPTLEGFSRIHTAYLKGDQQKYFLPCPCCGEFQWLKTERLKFSFTKEEYLRFDAATKIPVTEKRDEDTSTVSLRDGECGISLFHPNSYTWEIGEFAIKDTRRAMYVCEHCHRGWTDSQRLDAYMSGHGDNAPVISRMVIQDELGNDAAIVNRPPARAHWQATAPFKGVRSRQLSGMYLSIGLKPGYDNYLHQFAEDFLEAKHGGRETLMVWTNIFKCEPYEEASEKVDWKTIKERAEDYGPEMPEPAVMLSFACDVQKDRLEVLWVAHGDQEESWVMERHVIYGSFDNPEMQASVEDYLFNKRFIHPVLGEVKFAIGAIDSAHQTHVKEVYQFCGRHRLDNIWATRGFGAEKLSELYQCKKERLYKGLIANLNVDAFKTMVFSRLSKESGPRCIHFPKTTDFDDAFYKQICSERRFPVKQPNGGIVWKWRKLTSDSRNEMLDCLVYNIGIIAASRRREEIARIWKDVQAKVAPKPDQPKKDYILKPVDEKPVEPEKAVPQSKPITKPAPRPMRKKQDGAERRFGSGRGGMFNPFGL